MTLNPQIAFQVCLMVEFLNLLDFVNYSTSLIYVWLSSAFQKGVTLL